MVSGWLIKMANSEHAEFKYSLCKENEAAQSMIEVGTITETVEGTEKKSKLFIYSQPKLIATLMR